MNLTRKDIKDMLGIAYGNPEEVANSWSLQGFGMLRLHLPDDWRLSVWHPDFAIVGVSDIHDHPWDFTSYVVNGRMQSLIYQVPAFPVEYAQAEHYHCKEIKPGENSVDIKQLPDCALYPRTVHNCTKGQSYRQAAHEIHKSVFSIGCVTLMKRTRRQLPDVARTFWPQGSTWISAEPRPATEAEVLAICGAALEAWE